MSGAYWRETPARPDVCPRCRAAILRAIAEGCPCRLDPVPVTLRGELHARLRGRLTYEMRGSTITYREPERIAGGRKGHVLAEHKCWQPIPLTDRAAVLVAPVTVPEDCDGFPY